MRPLNVNDLPAAAMPDTTRILMDLLQLAHLMPPTSLPQAEAAEPPAKRRLIQPRQQRKLPLSEATNMRSRCGGNHQPDQAFKKPPLTHGHAETSAKN